MTEPQDRDEQWRTTYAELQQEEGPDCPAVEILTAMVLGELDPDEKSVVVDHTLECRLCTRRVKDVMELRDAAPPARTAPGRAWFRPVAAAAAVGAVLLLGWIVTDDRGTRETTHQSRGERDEIARAIDPPQDARLEQAPETLTWEQVHDAVSYRVAVFDSESTPLWTSDAAETSTVTLPADLRDRLTLGGTYYWRVTAVVGVEPFESSTHRFTLAP